VEYGGSFDESSSQQYSDVQFVQLLPNPQEINHPSRLPSPALQM